MSILINEAYANDITPLWSTGGGGGGGTQNSVVYTYPNDTGVNFNQSFNTGVNASTTLAYRMSALNFPEANTTYLVNLTFRCVTSGSGGDYPYPSTQVGGIYFIVKDMATNQQIGVIPFNLVSNNSAYANGFQITFVYLSKDVPGLPADPKVSFQVVQYGTNPSYPGGNIVMNAIAMKMCPYANTTLVIDGTNFV